MNYIQYSRSPLYSYLFTLPLFLAYEFGLFIISSRDIPQLRNGADVLMRNVLETFGLLGMHGFGFMLLFGFMLVFIVQRKKWKATEFNLSFLFIMFAESVIWSAGLFLIMNISNQVALMNPNTRFLIQRVVLSIGAGIYEEFVFRLLFIGGFTYLIGLVLQWKKFGRKIGAVVLSSVIFSLFHFVGVLGDQPDVGLFFVRFVAGLFLGGLYCFRGFGITACTHALYDLIILVMVVT